MGSFIATIIGGLLAGLIIGPLGRLVLPGKQDISLGKTILVGAGAAIVGGLIADWIGVGATSGIDWIKHAIQIALAAGGIVLFANMPGSKS
ncbi:MAG: GlsB/YeaQ/YmgE family stress response membrane protein [Actinomycetota bacterium]